MEIYNQDALEFLFSLEDNSVDLVLSDPPYGVNFSKIKGDTKDIVLDMIPGLFEQFYRILKPDSYIFLFVGVRNIENWIIEGKKYFEFKNMIATRCFNNGSCVPKNNFGFQFQPILLFSKGKGKNFNKVDFIPTSEGWFNDKRNKNPQPYTYQYPNWIKTEWTFATEKRASKNYHPTEKNVKLMKFLIETTTNKGDLVIDPFMGSGSTGVAALETGRDFKGTDIDTKYFNVAKERLNHVARVGL